MKTEEPVKNLAQKIRDAEFKNILQKLKDGKTLTARESKLAYELAERNGEAEESEGRYSNAGVDEVAELFGVTPARVHQLVADAVVIRTSRGAYDLWQSAHNYIRFLRTRKANQWENNETGDYEVQRTRVYKARAEILEAQSQAIQGQLHDAACITEVVGEGLANLRAKMLAIPNTAGPRVADESDPNKCAAMIETLIHEALTECSKYNGREVVNRYLKRNEPKQEEEEAGEAWET